MSYTPAKVYPYTRRPGALGFVCHGPQETKATWNCRNKMKGVERVGESPYLSCEKARGYNPFSMPARTVLEGNWKAQKSMIYGAWVYPSEQLKQKARQAFRAHLKQRYSYY